MVRKHLLCPERVRKIPSQFSWIDQRLVRHRRIDRLSHRAAALYLFLVVVADARGLSYYSDSSLCQRLDMDAGALTNARCKLVDEDLLAYRHPLYQVLDFEKLPAAARTGEPCSLQQIFKQIGGGR